ncbi:MAG: bifunctional ornithine acetyltransferase/N-acetylglutamate synthase [Gammaproteobacteria bacterium]|nr:bifunctional ornithine acetyltransferase/N-acetylglutamate synthase [Gammaproteobacteria bacterium]
MAVGLSEPVVLLPVPGIRLAACSAGLYRKQRPDLALLALDEGTVSAAVFTCNQFCAAPVQIARQHLKQSNPLYYIINAGNANAGTGKRGIEDATRICQELSTITGCDSSAVLPFSTGVIGEYLPVTKMLEKIPGLYASLAADNWLTAVRAIMTTDTIAKAASRQVVIDGCTVTISGIAKGSGMIRPDMATMLAFICTDVLADRITLDRILSNAVSKSFNRISVDGDSSTNDACMLAATGKSGCEIIQNQHSRNMFEQALTEVFIQLAQAIVRDGEGATKFITIEVNEGRNNHECLQVAYAIANSPLVKTAFFASDPNWGRILAAIGRAGIPELAITRISVYLGDVCIVESGVRAAQYSESAGQAVMKQQEITLRVCLGRGKVTETIWSCDLSHDYVRINAEYRS